jgi:hypothetical protein
VTDGSRKAYLSIAGVMLTIGGVGMALGLVDGAFSLGLFRGSPVLTAGFVLAIGAALRWTALTADARPEAAEDDGDAAPADDADGDAPGDEDARAPRP